MRVKCDESSSSKTNQETITITYIRNGERKVVIVLN
jgi:hypothetical protein